MSTKLTFQSNDIVIYAPDTDPCLSLEEGLNIRHHSKVTSKNPGSFQAFLNRANAYLDRSQYRRAMKDYDDAIRLNPSFARAHLQRGVAYEYQTRNSLAMKDYDEAIRLDPRYAVARLARGLLCLNTFRMTGKGRKSPESQRHLFDTAVEDFGEVIGTGHPKLLWTAYHGRGNTYSAVGQYEAAIRDFDEAIRLMPNDSSSYYNRGNGFAALSRFELAIADYRESLRLNPHFDCAQFNLAFAYERDGKRADAEAAFDRIASMPHVNPLVRFSLGLAYESEGKKDYAIATLESLISMTHVRPSLQREAREYVHRLTEQPIATENPHNNSTE